MVLFLFFSFYSNFSLSCQSFIVPFAFKLFFEKSESEAMKQVKCPWPMPVTLFSEITPEDSGF